MIHLNNEQRRAVYHENGPMLVLAGPGSGKTAVITERVRFLLDSKHVKADTVLVLTFSNKAANEMQRRFISNYGHSLVHFGTFHSVFFNVLKQYKKYGKNSIVTINQSIAIIRDIVSKQKIDIKADGRWCLDFLNDVSSYKNTGKIPKNLLDEEAMTFPDIAKEYNRRLNNEGLIDFDDMIIDCYKLLKDNPNILERVRNEYQYILIDEFQDCNSEQYELIKLVAGDKANIFAVGDDDQSIYGFRGAFAGIVLKFLNDYKGCGYVELIRNYRCSKTIIDASYALIGHNRTRKDKTKQLPSILRDNGEVCVIRTEDAYSEAEIVCEIIERLSFEGLRYDEISVLYRTETVSDYLRECLNNKKIKTNRSFSSHLFDKEYFTDVLSYLRISQNRYSAGDYYRIINKPFRGLLRECVDPENPCRSGMLSYYRDDIEKQRVLENLFDSFDFISDLDSFAAINYIWKKYIGIGERVPEDLKEYAKENRSIRDFINKCEEKHSSDNRDAIVLQTIHSSKGLEYDTVIIIGLQEGIMPHNRAKDEESLEEERRLMYVAMTRAKKRLYLIARGKETHGKKYSRFINEIE